MATEPTNDISHSPPRVYDTYTFSTTRIHKRVKLLLQTVCVRMATKGDLKNLIYHKMLRPTISMHSRNR